LQQPILERAGGNPLYAEEFVRLLKDRDLLVRKGLSWDLKEGAEVPFPESVQALIAARLDTLEPDAKSLLADAAVIGKVFWAGAVAAMGERDVQTVTSIMRELSRKELIRPARQSSMTGEAEYAFWHILARDVAYGQLPRPSRVTRHVAAATWLEAKAGERVEDIADVLAYHYATALELTRAAGQTDQAAELEAPALRFLTLAGEKALNLDLVAACSSLRHAFELAPEGHPGRARLLTLLARAEELSGRLTEAVRLYEEAVGAYRAAGDEAAADEATRELSVAVANAGDVARSESLLDELLGRVEGERPSELLALVYCSKQYLHQEDLTWAEKALTIADQLDLPSVRRRALNMRGLARAASSGDPGGITDLHASLALALEAQATREANTTYVNLAGCLALVNPAAALEAADEGIAFASARGLSPNVRAIRQWALLRLGRWDDLLEAGREIVSVAEPLGDRWIVGHAAAPMALVLTRRGATDAAAELARTSSSELTKELFSVPPIVAHRTRGALADAERLLEGAVQIWVSEGAVPAWNFDLCDLARETTALRRPDLLETLLAIPAAEQGAGLHTKTAWLAIAAEAAGRHDEALALFQDAEQGWRESGDPMSERTPSSVRPDASSVSSARTRPYNR
jgi:tetratricopeptide (TPR) repeat protein